MDWTKYVIESGGAAIFLPEPFHKENEKLEKDRLAFNDQALIMAKKEIQMNVSRNDLFLKIREYLEVNGHPDIWVKEIGFNADALAQGMYILTIRENRQ
jgi:hypothetical protein